VWTVAWSPDGKQLASAGMDGTIRIWEPATGSCRHVLKGRSGYGTGYITAVAWSPDGKRLASVGYGREVQIWDADSGQVLLHNDLSKAGQSLAWSPDGKQLVVATETGQCLLYNAVDCSRTSQWDTHKGSVNWVAWNPDGSQLLSAGADNLVKLWDARSHACVGILRGHVNQVMCVAWEPNGRRLASGGMDGKVKVWSVPPVSQPHRLAGHPGGTQTIAWYKDADTLQSLGVADGSIALWDVVSGKRVAKVSLGRCGLGQFSSAGERLAVVAQIADYPAVILCDARSGNLIQIVKGMIPHGLSFSPDGSRLALIKGWAADEIVLQVVDLQRNEVCFRWKGTGFGAVSWSPDGRLLALAGPGDASDGGTLQWAGWVHVFDLDKGQRIWKLRHGAQRVGATAVTWSPNGQRLVSGDVNGLAEVCEATTGKKIVSVQLHTTEIKTLAWSPDGRRIASAGGDQTVRIWDPISGEELLRFDLPDTVVKQLQWSADGRRLAAACADSTIQIWDASIGYHFANSESYYAEQVHAQLGKADELRNSGRNGDAIALGEQTVRDCKAKLGPDHPDTLTSMDDLAEGYLNAGRLQEAITLIEQTLEKRRATLGPDDKNTLATMQHLATAYRGAGRLSEALALLEQKLEKTKGKIGPDPPTTLNNLAVVYFETGRLSEAIALLESVVEKRKAMLGPDHSDTILSMDNLAFTYLDAGKLDKADRLLRDLLQLRRKKDGPKSAETAGALAILGLNLLKQQQYVEAETIFRECLAIREQKLPDDWLRYNAMSLLGGALLGQKKYDAAESLLLQGYEGMKQRETKIPPHGKVRLGQAAERLVQLYEAINQPDKARTWREKLPSGKHPGK
jgi:WD40 repeat protein/Tfp pilus assembly protein PilF